MVIEPMGGMALVPGIPGVALTSVLYVGFGCPGGAAVAEQATSSIAGTNAAVHSAAAFAAARWVRRDTTGSSGFG
jgi:hypothetical protein